MQTVDTHANRGHWMSKSGGKCSYMWKVAFYIVCLAMLIVQHCSYQQDVEDKCYNMFTHDYLVGTWALGISRIGYDRRFILNFAKIAVPLTDATKKGRPNQVEWEKSMEASFQVLKGKVLEYPILRLPDIGKPFVLRTDASDEGVGAILLQEHTGELFPIAYASKKLNKSQRRYSVMERECLALVWAVMKFSTYLYGREFIIETDHQPLTCLRKSKVANGRIMRWALALQPYRFHIRVLKGVDNVGADYLSRCSVI